MKGYELRDLNLDISQEKKPGELLGWVRAQGLESCMQCRCPRGSLFRGNWLREVPGHKNISES